MSTSQSRSQLRQTLRRRRRDLTPSERRLAARQLDRRLTDCGFLSRYRDIGFYLANDGEIDPAAFMERALLAGKRCYLPVLDRGNHLWFVRYQPGDPMIRNRFGIPEPLRHVRRAPWSLGLLLVPLVGFDRCGARLGMGGGFYDRTLSYLQRPSGHRTPRLVGLAHSCQEVARLEVESWDIPLSAIVTEKEVISPGEAADGDV